MKKEAFKFLVILLILGLIVMAFIETIRGKRALMKMPSVEETESITLRVAWWGSEIRNKVTLEVIDSFMERYPDIKVEAEYSEFDGYWNTLAVQAALQTMPDIIQQDYRYISRYAQKGLLEPLNSYIEEGFIEIDAINESVMKAGTIKNQVYGICLGLNTQTMFYHPKILEEAEVTLKENMTWDDYEEICQKIYEQTGVYSSPIYSNDVLRGIELFVRNAGYCLYAEDQKGLGFKDEGLVEDYFDFIKKQSELGIITPLEFNKPNQPSYKSSFIKKVDWNNFGWSNGLVEQEGVLKEQVGIQMIPQDVEAVQNSHYIQPSMFFSISKESSQKEAAALFINYFVNSIQANKILLGERGIPVSYRVREALKKEMTDSTAEVFDFVSKVETYASPIGPPDPAGAAEITALGEELLDQVLYDEITPKEAAQKFMLESTVILAKNN